MSRAYRVPAAVRAEARDGLSLRRQYGRGGTHVGIATARLLSRARAVSAGKVRHIARYFPRHAGDRLDDPTSNGTIAWKLWGGDAGREWSTAIVRALDARERK